MKNLNTSKAPPGEKNSPVGAELIMQNSIDREDKDKKPLSQQAIIFSYLSENICTASMLSEATKIPVRNICKVKNNLMKANLLFEIEKKPCAITKRLCWWFTCNRKFIEVKKSYNYDQPNIHTAGNDCHWQK